MAFAGRMREVMRKYGKVALGVHFSVSFASISGLYVAIANNVDVDAVLQKVGLSTASASPYPVPLQDPTVILDEDEFPAPPPVPELEKRNRTVELAASSGGVLALAILCNKALFPVRVPITIALTPPVSRFLARWSRLRNHARTCIRNSSLKVP